MPFIVFQLIMKPIIKLLKIKRSMKDVNHAWLLVSLMLSACGQPGPLYLPSSKPPIYVEPEPETKSTEPNQQQIKPEVPLQPKLNQPTKNR